MTHDPVPGSDRFVRRYVQHHWVAAQGGLDLFHRASRSQGDPSVRAELARLAEQVSADQEALREILHRLHASEVGPLRRLISLGETVARVKLNGTLFRRSPLSNLVELEALSAAVMAKKLGWLGMRRLADYDDRFDPDQLDRLAERAEDQHAVLERTRLTVVPKIAG